MNVLKQQNKSDNSLPWLLFSLGLLIAVTYPIFTYEYLFHDDWHHFSGSCPWADWLNRLGRPLGGAILCFQFSLFHHIGDAYIARSVTFAGIAILLTSIYFFLRRENLPEYLSSLIAFGCSVMPGILVSAYWLGAGFIIFSLLASVFSALLCQSALKQETLSMKFYGLILTAILIEIVSASIYQAGAMMFLVFAAVAIALILKSDESLALKSSLIYGGTFFAANLSYFLGFKYFVANELAQTNPERGILFHELGNAFVWFFQTVLPRAARLWFIDTSGYTVPLIIGLIFTASIAIYIYSVCKKNFNRRRALLIFVYVVMILFLCVACFLPVLVSSFRWNVFRSLTPLSSFILSMTCIQLWLASPEEKRAGHKINYLILSAMLFIAFFAHNVLLTKMVLPKSAEVRYLRNVMQAAKISGRNNLPVHVVIPRLKESFCTEEIGFFTASFHQYGDLQMMINHIRREIELPYVNVSWSVLGDNFNPIGKIVADYSALANTWGAESYDYNYINNKPDTANQKSTRYICIFCGNIYDPVKGDPRHGIAPGTKFEDLPESWRCPVCGAHK